MTPPLALSDEQFAAIRNAAAAVPNQERADFLQKVAAGIAELAPDMIGLGTINTVMRQVLSDRRFMADYAVGPAERLSHRRASG
jgi:hypothetical protein